MCVEPTNLPDGQQVACRYCWQCNANRVKDLVGRCIAEQTTSAASYAVTLTYAGDGPETAILQYRDVQLMLKLIRRKGFSVRYIVAGEFGTKKGRAHWHAVLFFSCVGPHGPMPIPRIGNEPWDIRIGERINWKPWPHGYAFFQQPDYGGFAYCLKYALKDQQSDVSKGHLAMSKKPPLGHEYFMDLANRHVEQQLAPQDLFYSFANVFDAKRKRRAFLLQGVSRQNFLTEFETRWCEVHGTEPPISQTLMDHWDKLAREWKQKNLTDAEWLAGKNQWPKYVQPTNDDVKHYGGEWRDGIAYMPFTQATPLRPLSERVYHPYQRYAFAAEWPLAFWKFTPSGVVEIAARGGKIDIVLEARMDDPRPLGISIGEHRWHVNAETMQMVFEWMHEVLPPEHPTLDRV